MTGCFAPQQVEQTPVEERFEVMVVFASLEAVKRVPVRYPSVRFELGREVSDKVFEATVISRSDRVEGVLEKLRSDPDVRQIMLR